MVSAGHSQKLHNPNDDPSSGLQGGKTPRAVFPGHSTRRSNSRQFEYQKLPATQDEENMSFR